LTLVNLDLGVYACFHLAAGLVQQSSNGGGGNLRQLNLNQNRIGTKGVQLICEAMRENSKIESLFMDENMIDKDGAYAIGKMLINGGSSLKELHLAGNKIASAGLNVILDALAKHNKRLRFLDIS
jgi:Ran GTPase-activating protein (RanGAP) involved in mRNA processing and transport